MTFVLTGDDGPLTDDDGAIIEYSRAEAEDKKGELSGLFNDLSIERRGVEADDEIIKDDNDTIPNDAEDDIEVSDGTKQALDTLNESMEQDPLNVLPKYMITKVDGKPSLNKRGVSVLAYHYDIDVIERDVVAYPHDHDFQTAVVEIMVESGDGRTFSGIGEAHADETPKHQLLRMAETRAYKRAVIFATGTGIVSYQEMISQLEGDQ